MHPTLFVLYENPVDHRGKFVLRAQVGKIMVRTPLRVSTALSDVLSAIPKGAVPIGRHYGDDPAIKDVWAAGPVGRMELNGA
jgi:hypothetical protein